MYPTSAGPRHSCYKSTLNQQADTAQPALGAFVLCIPRRFIPSFPARADPPQVSRPRLRAGEARVHGLSQGFPPDQAEEIEIPHPSIPSPLPDSRMRSSVLRLLEPPSVQGRAPAGEGGGGGGGDVV